MSTTPLQRCLRNVNLFGAAAVVLLLSATAAFGVYPLMTKGKNYNRDAEALRGKQSELITLSSALQDAERSFQQTQTRLAFREQQLPSWDKEPNFYGNELTKIRKADNIQLSATDVSKDLKPWNGYRVGYIEIRGSGDWNATAKFLADIHGMKGLARLDTLVLDVNRDSSAKDYEQPRCEFHISFSIFFKGE